MTLFCESDISSCVAFNAKVVDRSSNEEYC